MKLIPLTNGGFSQVDDELFDWLSEYNWWSIKCKNSHYAYTWMNGKNIPMHRFIFGKIPKGLVIDHKDTDGLNNQNNNLRYATKSQNAANRKCGKNKYLGVCFQGFTKNGKTYRYWIAKAYKDRKGYRVRCNSEIEAALKYNELAIMLHGDFAKLNVITN